MPVIHHDEIRRRLKLRYEPADIDELTAFLRSRGTLTMTPLSTGLYPAAGGDAGAVPASGYGNAWTRDNVHIAFALDAAGDHKATELVMTRLAEFYRHRRERFTAVIEGRADRRLPSVRPPIRFDGVQMAELPDRPAQAQNDALGYFLWFYCRLAQAGRLPIDAELLSLFVRYFRAIRYWADEDSGHWEERRKIEASSIGAVVAALRAVRALSAARAVAVPRFLDDLVSEGERALGDILPWECIQPDPRRRRRYDAALLFLIYPLDVIDDEAMARQIVSDVVGNLQGDYGIRRYLGDSYWTADYKERVLPSLRTAEPGTRQDIRDAFHRPGEEAQWCIFDPIVSIICGRRYLRGGDPADLARQTAHLNRALGQLTGPGCPQGELRCPEAYYLVHGNYIPNDNVPLLWTQANLSLALSAMRGTLTDTACV